MKRSLTGESVAPGGGGPRQVHVAAAEGAPCTLVFAPGFDTRDLRLFEVPQEVLEKVLEGQELSLIGEGDSVLCTGDKTFSMKKVETSNQLFFLQASEGTEFALTSRTSDYYEVKPTAPRLEQIEVLLLPTQYNGAEDEAENPPAPALLLSRSELLSKVQASRGEVESALHALGVVEMDGKMRLVSKAAVREVARNLLDTIMENGWSVDKLDGNLCSAAMTGVDPVMLTHTLSTLGSVEGGEGSSDSNTWRLSADAVAKVSAHGLFLAHVATTSKPWEYGDFLLSWAARTPGAEEPNPALLAGVCVKLTRADSAEAFLHYCPSDSLPLEPAARLAALFAIKHKYTAEELQPYMADLASKQTAAVGPKTVTELLLAHARLVDGCYTSK